MTGPDAAAGQIDGVELLERAIGYALGAVTVVTPALLARPTPCRDWDLRALLHHVNDSLAALEDGIGARRVNLDPAADDDLAGDPAGRFRDRARRLLGALTRADGNDRVLAVGDLPLAASILAGAGAIEIAAHGWDVWWACGYRRPLPNDLAVELLRIGPLLVADGGRHPLFADPVAVPAAAGPSDRLVAFLGRDPGS
jgi:uncharacterized protein (TIGR03086 family)